MAASFISSMTKQVPVANAGKFDPPVNAWYAEVHLKTSSNFASMMKRVIGAEGKAMKAITHQARVSYMWYFPERHTVGIWVVCGNEDAANERIEDAKFRLQERETYIRIKYYIQALHEQYDD
jgi:hypothetical protein